MVIDIRTSTAIARYSTVNRSPGERVVGGGYSKMAGGLLVGDQSSNGRDRAARFKGLWGCAESLAFDLFRGATNRAIHNVLRGFLGSSWSCDGIVRVAAYCGCVVHTMLVVWRSTTMLYTAVSELDRSESIEINTSNNRQPPIFSNNCGNTVT